MAKKTTKKVARKSVKTAAKKRTATKNPARKKATVTVERTKGRPTAKLEIYRLAKEVPREQYFVLANGRPVKHVAELAEILHDIEDHVFSHHVNPERNDFATWVKDVFKDLELAKKMLGISSKQHLQLVIYKHAAEKAFAHRP